MTNHDLILGQGHNLMGIQQRHDLVPSHNYGLAQHNTYCLRTGHLNHNDIGLSHQHEFGLRQMHHRHEITLGISQRNEMNHDSGVALHHENEDEVENLELDLGTQNPHSSFSGNHQFPVIEQNVELAVDHNSGFSSISTGDTDTIKAGNQSPIVVSSFVQSNVIECQLSVGQEFPDVTSCRRALREASIALHFDLQTIKSDKTRFTAKCATEGCHWRIHAAKLPGVPTFSIRTIHGAHTCGVGNTNNGQESDEGMPNSLLDATHFKTKEILEDFHQVHGNTLPYKQIWRGKEKIMTSVRGSFEEDYHLLPRYCDQIKWTNPGSIASVYRNQSDNSFQRLFVSFHASIWGFVNACRPLLGLDRTQLKSKYLGSLLLASGFDGDGDLFPLAFGVIDEENDENWMWFLSELRNLLEIKTENMPRLTILSNRHKGVVDGVEANFPTAFHGFCMHHLSDSFRKEFNNTLLVNLLWEAAHALTVLEFETKILEIEEISHEAAYWIRRIPPRLWATAYFEGSRFGQLTANIADSVSAWILEVSALPIIQMMESIRRQMMTWFNERRETSMQWTTILVPSAERRVSEAINRVQNYQVIRANETEFEVASHEGSIVVDIRNRFCLCRGWQLYGFPCDHAVAALHSRQQNSRRFTESCFTVATYRKTYSQTIHPIPDKSYWKELSDVIQKENDDYIIITPPKSIRPMSRPRKKRVRSEEQGRGKRVIHCSRCNQTGHFRTTCATPI